MFGSERSLDDARSWTNVLGEVPLFADLGARQRRKVASIARIRRFSDGAPLLQLGQVAAALYVVLNGDVLVRRPGSPDIKLGIGAVVGELALLDGGGRTATVVAKGEVVALAIPASKFHTLLRKEPTIAIKIAEELARRLRVATESD
jgi:CRP-like cAMP-binding protein